MSKLILFTDIHITQSGKTIIGIDPLERFEQGLAHALDHHPDAKGIIISGDLVHRGSLQEYERLKASLANCPLPVHLMLGNHDDRANFCTAFNPDTSDTHGFVQFRLDFGDHTILCLDTKDQDGPDPHSGYICAKRLTWLDSQLKDARGQFVTVIAHHPPLDIWFPGMDAIKLRNGGALTVRAKWFHQLICGHVHRTIMGSLQGLPFAILKSTCHQAALDFNARTTATSIDEPGAYGVILMGKRSVVIHTEDFTLPTPALFVDPHSVTQKG
jgi:Icc protein